METLLTRNGCLARQQRLRSALDAAGSDAFLTGHVRTIYYLAGVLLAPETPAALIIRRNGGSVLVSPASEAPAVDECVQVETYSIVRYIADACADAAALLKQRNGGNGGKNWAVELSYTPALFTGCLSSASVQDAGPIVRALRKRKHDDEIAEIRRSLALSRVAYEAARSAVRPGVSEIDVYSAMLQAALRHAGHTFDFAGDFAGGLRCVRGGGPPTSNRVQGGDLYILDLFPACAFYFGDTCRTYAVGEPTDEQQGAWETVSGTLAMAEQIVKPGLAARDLYSAVRDRLATHPKFGASFWHHAGHGVGLHGHDSPRLIPASDEVIEAGDVIAIEPALYSDELRGGIRLENTYLVHETGVERLFNYPLAL